MQSSMRDVKWASGVCRWDSAAAGSPARSNGGRQRRAALRQDGPRPVRARARSLLRHTEAKHLPVQQLRLALRLNSGQPITRFESAPILTYKLTNDTGRFESAAVLTYKLINHTWRFELAAVLTSNWPIVFCFELAARYWPKNWPITWRIANGLRTKCKVPQSLMELVAYGQYLVTK